MGKIIIAIPVKDEAARIGSLLASLQAQTHPHDHLLLLLNNCTDATLQICAAANPALNIRIEQCVLPSPLASAGEARRLALGHAQALAGDGIILTTDADTIPAPEWIAQNLAAIHNGADMVCGQASMEAADGKRLPPGMHFDGMREAYLLNLLDEIDALINPDPADPWPRHQQNSGASIAMRAATLHAAGGAPHVSNGEDRALVQSFRLIDARIRHDPDITVTVSGRLDGRATAGMATTIKRRLAVRDTLTDDRIEPAVDAYRRALAKARLRTCRQNTTGAASLAADLLISETAAEQALHHPYFGAAWQNLQAASPVLQRRRVAFFDLARETRQAMQLRDSLHKDLAVPLIAAAAHVQI